MLDYSGSFSITANRLMIFCTFARTTRCRIGKFSATSRFVRTGTSGCTNGTAPLSYGTSSGRQCRIRAEVAGICGSGICNLDRSGVDASCTGLPKMNSRNHIANLTMDTVPQTNYYFLGPSTIANYSNVTEHCLSICECVASAYGLVEENTYCWTLRSMLFGGMQDPSSTLFVKVGNTSGSGFIRGRTSTDGNGNRDRAILLPLLLRVRVLVVLAGLLLGYGIQKRRIRLRREALCKYLSLPGAPVYSSYHDLQNATSNFSRLLGTGRFGSVYKGTLRDGTSIAVKKLERLLPRGKKEFITEVTTIGSMHHMNLITIVASAPSEHTDY